MNDKYLWIAVTADEYELPIAIETSAKKLGKCLGVSQSTIKSSLRRGHNGQKTGTRIYRIKEE